MEVIMFLEIILEITVVLETILLEIISGNNSGSNNV